MVINAKERFIQRMADTMRANRETDTPSQARERFAGHAPEDRAKAYILSVKSTPKK